MSPSHPFPRLIINADDFGLTLGVNRAIAELHDSGAITSATLMANGAAFKHAVQVASQRPTLAVGAHIVLIRGKPLAPMNSVASLLGHDGQFHESLPRFLFELQRGRIVEAEMEVEARAQIHHLQQAGIAVSHVDTHKHPHLFTRVARPLIRAATACGVGAIRNPFEPSWSARFSRTWPIRAAERVVLRGCRKKFHALCRQHGIGTSDGCIGVTSTATLDENTLPKVIERLPAGTYELICHPGYHDADLIATRSRLQQSRDTERQALMRLIPNAVQKGKFNLINFTDLE